MSKFSSTVPCPVCLGTARNPEAPAIAVCDGSTAQVCRMDKTDPLIPPRSRSLPNLGTMDSLNPDVLVPCPVCRGTGQNPEAPAAIANDFGTCPVCCDPTDPRYAAHHGLIRAEV